MKTTLNLSLLSFLLVLLLSPVVALHVLVARPTTPGTVAGTQTVTNEDLAVIPNFTDFGEYVSFAPQPLEKGIYRDEVTLTVFPTQIANYNELYSIYNNTPHPILLRLSTQKTRGDVYTYQDMVTRFEGKTVIEPNRVVLQPNQKVTVAFKITGNPSVADFVTQLPQITVPLTIVASY